MGFEANTNYTLTFENPALKELVVKVRGATIRTRKEYNDLDTDDEIIDWFPKVLVEWNIKIDGKPLPCTADGIRELEFEVFNEIISAWRNAKRVQPPAPLEQPSPVGEPSEVASIPMETLPPESRAS